MSKALITEQHLTNIADAIISKGGASAPLKPSEMAAAIRAIPTGDWIKRPWFEGAAVKNIHAWLRFDKKNEDKVSQLVFKYKSADGLVIDWGDGKTKTFPASSSYAAVNTTHRYGDEIEEPLLEISGASEIVHYNSPMFSDTTAGTPHYNSALECVRQLQIGKGFNSISSAMSAYPLFGSMPNLEYLKLEEGIKTIGSSSFDNNIHIKEIEFNDDLESVSNTFGPLRFLTNLSLPRGLQIVGNCFSTLYHCRKLTLPVGNGIFGTKMNYSFDGIGELEELVIPDGITEFSTNQLFRFFRQSRSGLTITCYCREPPQLASSSFWGIASTIKIRIPKGTMSLYESATNWSTYSGRYEEMES